MNEKLALLALQLMCSDTVNRAWLALLTEIIVRDVVAIKTHAFHMLPYTATIATDHVAVIMFIVAV